MPSVPEIMLIVVIMFHNFVSYRQHHYRRWQGFVCANNELQVYVHKNLSEVIISVQFGLKSVEP